MLLRAHFGPENEPENGGCRWATVCEAQGTCCGHVVYREVL